jgi:hypothetical protein
VLKEVLVLLIALAVNLVHYKFYGPNRNECKKVYCGIRPQNLIGLFEKDMENDCKRGKVEQMETGDESVYVDIAIFTGS